MISYIERVVLFSQLHLPFGFLKGTSPEFSITVGQSLNFFCLIPTNTDLSIADRRLRFALNKDSFLNLEINAHIFIQLLGVNFH